MLRVVETFSGIGSQAKALKNIKADDEIVATVEWDINAILAYDFIHNGKQPINNYENIEKKELLEILSQHTLSADGKKPLEPNSLRMMSVDMLRRILCSIDRNNNLVSITDVTAEMLPDNTDLLTYSFPCQDLSICGASHGNMTGIDRDANNRSGMLWEVERILKEHINIGKILPKFLLMENVSNILSDTHNHNFEEWQNYLRKVGYYNKVYTLDASNFGIPQRRKRTYMISVYCGKNEYIEQQIESYFEANPLDEEKKKLKNIIDFLRLDYCIPKYRDEADISNPNDTPSRTKIFDENDIIYDGENVKLDIIKTITTKQDRNPNSGLIIYNNNPQKAKYRNLTPRECFLLMGFDESDFQLLMDNNFNVNKSRKIFTREKLIKMAGNSIVVNVLEAIFQQIIYINENLL